MRNTISEHDFTAVVKHGDTAAIAADVKYGGSAAVAAEMKHGGSAADAAPTCSVATFLCRRAEKHVN